MRTSTRLLVIATLAAATVLSTSRADAQHPHVTPLHRDPFQMPEVYGHHKLGLDFMFGQISAAPFVDEINLMALELFGAYRVSRRLYLHARLPLGYASAEDYSGTALGNLTLGLEHRLSTSFSRGQLTAWSLGGSVSLPTASDSGDAGLASVLHGAFRLPYPGRYYPDTTALRVHGQFRLDTRSVFLQGQAGLNMLIIDGADDWMLLRFGLALGVSLGRSAVLIAELTTMSDILDDSDGDNFWHSLDLGVRFRAGTHTRVGIRVYLPLDAAYRDQDIWGIGLDITQWL